MRKITIILLAALTSLLVGGCSVYDKDTCLAGGDSMRVVMNISVPQSQQTKAVTKATGDWGDAYYHPENGDEYDNYIDLETLQILFYKPDGSYVAAFKDYVIIPATGPADQVYEQNHIYKVIGTVDNLEDATNLEAGDYKVVVLANCPAATTGQPIANLASLAYANFNPASQYIPMWGMATHNFKFEKGEEDNIGNIKLLRSTAKLEVKLTWNDDFKESWLKVDAEGQPIADDYQINLEDIKIKSAELLWHQKAVNCLPSADLASINIANTEAVMQEGGFNPATADLTAASRAFTAADDGQSATLITPEFEIGTNPADGAAADDAKILKIVIEEPVPAPGTGTRELTFYVDPKITATTTTGPGQFVRNHLYRFNVVYYAGALYINPTVAPWENAEELEYTLNLSTNMRLFDSWLYRYDTDEDLTLENYGDWATSHMAVSSGRVVTPVEPELVAGRPLRSPQIQLVTTGTGTFELAIDNDSFEIVRANKNDTGIVTSYDASTEDGVLTIAAGTDVYTYFYIVPKVGVTPANPVAKVRLFYYDPVVGKQEVTFNYNVLPGYSDDSSEIWAYYFAPEDYNINGKLRMYYQDATHPLVPTAVQS